MTIRHQHHTQIIQVGPLRRIGALCYDSLLLLALLFVAMAILTPFTDTGTIRAHSLLYFSYLLMVSFVFFGWFWTRGGQTLGMRAWKIRVVNRQGTGISWGQALARFSIALLTPGIGLLWSLMGSEKLALYDRWSGTQVVRVPRGFVPPASNSPDTKTTTP